MVEGSIPSKRATKIIMNTKIFLYPFNSHNDQNPLEASNHRNADKTVWVVTPLIFNLLIMKKKNQKIKKINNKNE